MVLRKRFKHWLYDSCPGFAGCFPYFGTRVYFPTGADILDVVCQEGIYEPEIVKRLIRLAESDSTLFDVGANIGLMAIPVLHACSTCRVVSFEPSPSSLPFLERTAAESAYSDRWSVIGKGLSRELGELDFTVLGPKNALYEGFKIGKRTNVARTVKVPVSTIDEEWCRLGRTPISVIKIDVEGAEGLVLDGAHRVLSAFRPNLVVEWYEEYLHRFSTPPEQLLSIAAKHGYRIYTIPGGVPVDDARTLRIQMVHCSNYLLSP